MSLSPWRGQPVDKAARVTLARQSVDYAGVHSRLLRAALCQQRRPRLACHFYADQLMIRSTCYVVVVASIESRLPAMAARVSVADAYATIIAGGRILEEEYANSDRGRDRRAAGAWQRQQSGATATAASSAVQQRRLTREVLRYTINSLANGAAAHHLGDRVLDRCRPVHHHQLHPDFLAPVV